MRVKEVFPIFLLMNSLQSNLHKNSLSLFISNRFAPIIASVLELFFFNLASKFRVLLHCWRCSKMLFRGDVALNQG